MSFFTFQADLPHQLAAVQSVVEVLDGLEKRTAAALLNQSEDIIGNAAEFDDLADDLLEENLHRVQAAHNLAHPEAVLTTGRLTRDDGAMLDGVSIDAHSCPHFTIEMETGTGKTYVYLRTMLELHQRYGFTKFIVVVPSVAILEGVKKSFDDTKDHFKALYGQTNFSRHIYDGSKPGLISAFARSTFPTLLVMTQQAFNKSSNKLYQDTDKIISELKPYQWLQRTRPVVILDEPQNMGSDTSKAAIRTLRPLFVLRYSATHRADDQPNPIYRLTPVQAFRLGLVKHVQVIGVAELGVAPRSTLSLVEVLRNPVRAKVKVLALEPTGETKEKTATIKQGESLHRVTHLPEHEGLKVANIRAASDGQPAYMELDGGKEGGRVLSTDDEIVGSSEEIWQKQIEETIKQHFERQRQLRAHGVKVLSLFFIDRVANYTGDKPRIRELFDACFNKLKKKEPDFKHFDAEDVREAYFAKNNQGAAVDETNADSDKARHAFELIMRKKETLLSFPNEKDQGTKVAFIFAHSALREGWDNPNVFQICTLNHAVSLMKKRQEIGRGLRLCVNQQGQRLTEPELNVLTVVANESYESYVRNLQTEYREAGGEAPPAPTRPGKATAKRREDLARNALFQQFWDKLCQRLEYTIDLDSNALINECVERLNDPVRTQFPRPMLAITRRRFVQVEYSLELVKALGLAKAQLRLREISTETETQTGLVPGEQLLNVEPGSDLVKLTKNPHFFGFKVMEVERHYGELQVRFENEVKLGEGAVHKFQTNRLDNRPGRELAAAEAERQVPDFISRTADEAFLTRATVRNIFAQVTDAQKKTLRAHPEGWANVFVRVVSETVKDHIAWRVRFLDTGMRDTDIGPIEEVFPPEALLVQRELVDGGKASLYDKVQVDSDVEKKFVSDHLKPDEENLVVYFKFPPKFKIGLPRIIGNYNPDWGVLRQERGKKLSLELVRETKGTDDLEKLRFMNEGRKLVLAERYFGTLGIDYRFVGPDVTTYWHSRRQAAKSGEQRPLLAKEGVDVVVYDLTAAATAFSEGQQPAAVGRVRLESRRTRRPGLFVAKIKGNSMNRVAPDGSYCLWQHFGAYAPPPASGDLVIVRREDPVDWQMGEFTFKVWKKTANGAVLEPRSNDAVFKPIVVSKDDNLTHVARFIEVLEIDESDLRS